VQPRQKQFMEYAMQHQVWAGTHSTKWSGTIKLKSKTSKTSMQLIWNNSTKNLNRSKRRRRKFRRKLKKNRKNQLQELRMSHWSSSNCSQSRRSSQTQTRASKSRASWTKCCLWPAKRCTSTFCRRLSSWNTASHHYPQEKNWKRLNRKLSKMLKPGRAKLKKAMKRPTSSLNSARKYSNQPSKVLRRS